MKNKIVLLLAGACLVLVIGAGTIRRDIIDTSAYTRSLATNETVYAWLRALQINPVLTNFSGASFGGTNRFLSTGDGTNAVGTLDGGPLTNVFALNTTNASGTGTATPTNDSRSLVLTNYGNQFAGTFNGTHTGLLTGTTNVSGNFVLFNADIRPITLPNASVSNAAWAVTATTTTNASATGTAAATNDPRSLVLTNANNQFGGIISTSSVAIGASPSGTVAATNDPRSLVLTNGGSQFAGTFSGFSFLTTNSAPFSRTNPPAALVITNNTGGRAMAFVCLQLLANSACSIIETNSVFTNDFGTVGTGTGGMTNIIPILLQTNAVVTITSLAGTVNAKTNSVWGF